ncbi:rod shape-determining protein MreC [Bacteriovoracaceae bacterium]|nr:rod shape-determining protein MreC [Bacteriovoracaceae bacterium]
MSILVNDNKKRTRLILNIVVLLFALIRFASKDMTIKKTSFFENVVIDIVAPIQKSVTTINSNITGFFVNYVANVDASKKNIMYQKTIADLKGQLFELDEVIRENERLKNFLEFGESLPYKQVLAQVVAWDSNSDFKVIRINKGLKQGIKLQAPVITAEGLVGYVFRLTNDFADVLTVLDPNNRIDGIIQRVRTHGIVEGYSQERSIMKYVSRTEPIILNDLVITSGLGNIYPKGIKIGTVSRIERESYGITQYVEIFPAVDFGRLEEVAVLIGTKNIQRQKQWKALDTMDEGSEGARK